MYIDTHCHLYLPEFEDDIDLVIQRAEKEGVNKFYLPAIDSISVSNLIGMESRFPGKCYAMTGLHPCSVKENFREELQCVEEWLQKRRFAAIGEIGLDYYWDQTFKNEQATAFNDQIEWALHFDLPIVIHSRDALDSCIDIVKSHQKGKLKGIFHCFSGTYEQACMIAGMGFYLGIGGVITYKNAGLAETISNIPVENMVLETDAPYLSPVPFRGKRNESSYLIYIVNKLAEIKGLTPEEVGTITSRNAQNIFSC